MEAERSELCVPGNHHYQPMGRVFMERSVLAGAPRGAICMNFFCPKCGHTRTTEIVPKECDILAAAE